MQNSFEIEQGVPEIWGFKWSEMILLRETKKKEKIPLWIGSSVTIGTNLRGYISANNCYQMIKGLPIQEMGSMWIRLFYEVRI